LFHSPSAERKDQPQKEGANGFFLFYGVCSIPHKLVEATVINQFVTLVLLLSSKSSGLHY